MSSDQTNTELYTADGMWFKTYAEQRGAMGAPNTNCNANDQATEGNICSVVEVDVNGMKGPNRYTTSTTRIFDLFTIAIYPQKALPANETMGMVLYQK